MIGGVFQKKNLYQMVDFTIILIIQKPSNKSKKTCLLSFKILSSSKIGLIIARTFKVILKTNNINLKD